MLTVDTFIGDGDYVNGPVKFPLSFIASDNKQGGEIACEALIEAIGGKGKIYIQNVKPGISSTDAREEGCKEAIGQHPDVTLVGVDYNDDDPATAQAQTKPCWRRARPVGHIRDERVQRPGSRPDRGEQRLEWQGESRGVRCHRDRHRYAQSRNRRHGHRSETS